MDPLDAMVLVSLVKPGGSRWAVEAAIVTRLAQLRGGGWCWAAQAAEWTGADPVVCRRALSSLEARKVIKRDPGDTGRDNIRWCAVNDDWRRWRVEWLVDASQVAAQLALAAQQRDESPLTRVFARSLSARSLGRIARSFDARSWEEDLAEVTQSGKGAPSPRAIRIARSLGRHRPALERAIRGGEPSGGSPSGLGDDETPPSSVRIRSEEERCHDLGAMALKAKLLVLSIPAPGARDKWLSGPPLRTFNDLVEEFGLEEVELAMAHLEPGVASPLRNVEKLAALIHLAADERAPAPAPAAADGPSLRYELDEQRRQEALAEAGSPLPPEEAKARLAAVRSQWRPGWHDEGDGEGPEAIAR